MINIGIIGGSGYSGKELIRLLFNHKNVNIKSLFAKTSAGKKLSEVYPLFNKRSDLIFESFTEKSADGIDLFFLALPHGESMQYASSLMGLGKKIIDLGGDFRFDDVSVYEKWYKVNHTAVEYNKKFIYGLPELFRDEIIKSDCIANPGCYPTSAILALAPAVKKNILNNTPVIINSLSGVSGAGRKASVDLIFCEVNETVKAYKIGNHQHTPEIKEVLTKYGKKEVEVIFTPHLIPVNRGIYSTIYVTPVQKIDLAEIKSFYSDFYKNEPFVRIVDEAPQLQNVAYTNYCDIYINYLEDKNTLIIISALDNLVKGAAGQAIQNMNLLFNLNETEGLL
jgi:N-acetyl-gamma-glutamyl-phosphate reductase